MTQPPATALFTEDAPSSPVRVLIFEDLQCPDCADFRLVLDGSYCRVMVAR